MREFEIAEACENLLCDNDDCLRIKGKIKTNEKYIRVTETGDYGEPYGYNLCLQCALKAIEHDVEILEELYEDVDREIWSEDSDD